MSSTAITQGIRVSVRSRFEPAMSDPLADRYLFSYRITIANQGRRTVQLMRRRWRILDSMAAEREVEGPGVVGTTPVIGPGEGFSYTSYCDLRGGMGRMEGSFRMRHTDDGSLLEVAVPVFDLLLPYAAN